MFTSRRLTLLIIPEEGGRTYELKLPRVVVWVCAFLGLVVLFLLAVGFRSHLSAETLRGRMARLEQERGVLREQVALIRSLETDLRRLQQSNRQLRQIASTAVGLEAPKPVEREDVTGEHYISAVERLRWGRIHSVPTLWPVRGTVVLSYRPRYPGVAIRAPLESLIRATAAGRVTRVGYDETYGHVVELDHGNRIASRYGFTSSILVQVGQYVHKGQPIALVGSSGEAPGPSLFFAIEEDGESRDPERYRLWL
jgi:murein DD-endopeptidase MepM/ murein hydrolase activator NlpD